MDLLETPGVLEADSARLGRFDEAHRANKKYTLLIDPFPLDSLQFVRQGRRGGMAEKDGKGGRAHRRAVVELYVVWRVRRTQLPAPLQVDDQIDEGGPGPGLGDAARLFERNDVGRGLLHDAEAVELELPKEDRLSRTGRAGENEALHPGSAAMASRNGPINKAAKGSIFAGSLSL